MKAFTILEVIVSLLLSSIIIGMAILSYGMIEQQYRIFDEMTEENINLLQLHNHLRYDIDRADIIKYDNKQLVCNSLKSEIVYNLNDTYIKRNVIKPIQREDSIAIALKDIQPSFENKQMEYGIIDKITLRFNHYEKMQNLTYNKKYSAVQLMNINSLIQN